MKSPRAHVRVCGGGEDPKNFGCFFVYSPSKLSKLIVQGERTSTALGATALRHLRRLVAFKLQLQHKKGIDVKREHNTKTHKQLKAKPGTSATKSTTD